MDTQNRELRARNYHLIINKLIEIERSIYMHSVSMFPRCYINIKIKLSSLYAKYITVFTSMEH